VKSEMSMSNYIIKSSGATMFPNICPSDAAPGELEIFKMLAEDVNASGWIVLHSLDIVSHIRAVQGEADFVILIPNEGIIILEVKSHLSIRRNERGWWLGNDIKPDNRGPFRQASEALHSIRTYLEQRNLTWGVPFVSAVVFPRLHFQITSPEWHEWQVLDKQSLHARRISENLLTILRKARKFFASKNLPWMKGGVDVPEEKIKTITYALRPRFEVLCSPLERRRQLEDGLRRSTEQQLRVIDDAGGNPRLLVNGLAGTGKTTLAIEVVRRERIARSESVVGFFCFNRLLGRFLESECESLGTGIRSGSFHSWMMSFCSNKQNERTSADPSFWNKELPDQCIALLTAPGMPSGFLDLLVLDEAQDLFIESYLDVFDLLLKGGLKSGRWSFFGDFERQDIYAQGSVGRNEFFKTRIEERCSLQNLSENCRNTQEISAALTLHARLRPGYSKVLREDTRHDPEILGYKDTAQQLSLVQGFLDQYQAEGFKSAEIVLLSPQRYGCLAQSLADIPLWKGRIKEYDGDPKDVTFSTIHAFKGLEASVVILTDIDSLNSHKDFDLLYIGMSRALHRLVVLFHEKVAPEIKNSCML
jgi:UvrD-like helicase C-terminal domain/Nuclease-related domain